MEEKVSEGIGGGLGLGEGLHCGFDPPSAGVVHDCGKSHLQQFSGERTGCGSDRSKHCVVCSTHKHSAGPFGT